MEKPISDKNQTFGMASMLTAIFAAVPLASFFANRGDDVGQIGRLIGNLGSGPLVGSSVSDSFLGLLIAVFIVSAWFGLGQLLVSFIRVSKAEGHSLILEFAMKTALGAGVWSLIWFFFGVAGAFNRVSAMVALAFGIGFAVIGFRGIRESKNENRVPEKPCIFDRALLVLIAIPVVLAFIASLAPTTAKDTLLYHFAVPKAFIAQGSSNFIQGNIASFLALGVEMQNVWAMLLGGFISLRVAETAAGVTSFAFFPMLLMAIFGWARELELPRRWALIAALMVAAIPSAYHVAASGYIDLAMALYITLAILALTKWWRTLENGWLIFVAAFLSAALSAKLTALFAIAAFALAITFRARQAQTDDPGKVRGIFVRGFGALILAGIIASPWYLRTWMETGSPVFPFYMNIWPGTATGWDVERSNLFQTMNAAYGGESKTPLDYLLAPWNLSVYAQPEHAAFFDGVLGVSFLLGLPILVWALWKFEMPVEAKIGAGISAIMFVFWLFSSQQLRYLLPILPVIAIAISIALTKIFERRSPMYVVSKYAITLSAIGGILVSTAWFLQKTPLRVALGGETRDEYLIRNIDYYPYYKWLNTETPADAKVWLINMRRDSYNLDRPYFSDYLFEDWTLRQMVWESRSVRELKAKTAAMGVNYVLTRHDFLFDYARSPLVDDTKPKAENEAKLKIAREFILDRAATIHSDQRFSLIKVF